KKRWRESAPGKRPAESKIKSLHKKPLLNSAPFCFNDCGRHSIASAAIDGLTCELLLQRLLNPQPHPSPTESTVGQLAEGSKGLTRRSAFPNFEVTEVISRREFLRLPYPEHCWLLLGTAAF